MKLLLIVLAFILTTEFVFGENNPRDIDTADVYLYVTTSKNMYCEPCSKSDTSAIILSVYKDSIGVAIIVNDKEQGQVYYKKNKLNYVVDNKNWTTELHIKNQVWFYRTFTIDPITGKTFSIGCSEF